MRLLAIFAAAAPFMFAAIRLLQTASDRRPLWMAIAAFLGASAIIVNPARRVRTPVVLFGLTLVIVTLLAAGTGFLLGASAAPGVWAVSCAFGLAQAVAVVLCTRLHAPRSVSPTGEVSRPPDGRLLAAGELILILPALVFLTAVVVRYIPPLADPAQQVVMWYANRIWTLWVLLIALPSAALITGSAALLVGSSTANVGHAPRFSPAFGMRLPVRIIAVETLTAGMILSVVVLHMLAN
jgi:hypothetical protein